MNEAEFLRALGQDLRTSDLYRTALTHRSASGEHNERLEFLGDALLNFIIADELYSAKPVADEGALSRMRAQLVKAETLAELAVGVNLASHLQVGPGESADKHLKHSLLSDAMEAVFGAIYLHYGYARARELVLSVYGDRLRVLPEAEQLKDPKTRLQEKLQSIGVALPVYRLQEEQGSAHRRQFRIECVLDSHGISAVGEGASKKKAEQAAAADALRLLEQQS